MRNPSYSLARSAHQSPLLDVLRSAASLFVLLSHSRYLFFGTPAHVVGMAWPKKLLFLSGSFGSQSVVVFFVISGFLVGGPVLVNFENRRFRTLDYFVDRFSRIFIVLIPALIVSFAINAMGAAAFPSSHIADDLLPNWADFDILCHIACLQGLACSARLDPPLWSLGYEWSLYICAPFLFAVAFSPTSITFRAIAAALLIASAAVILPANAQWDLILAWLAGAAVRWWSEAHDSSPAGAIAGGLLATGGMLVGAFSTTPKTVDALMITAGLVLIFRCRRARQIFPHNPLFHTFAGFSYSLYAIHMPVIALCARVLEFFGAIDESRAITAFSLVSFVGTVCVSILSAFAFSRFTEAKTDLLRKAIRRSFRTREAGSPHNIPVVQG